MCLSRNMCLVVFQFKKYNHHLLFVSSIILFHPSLSHSIHHHYHIPSYYSIHHYHIPSLLLLNTMTTIMMTMMNVRGARVMAVVSQSSRVLPCRHRHHHHINWGRRVWMHPQWRRTLRRWGSSNSNSGDSGGSSSGDSGDRCVSTTATSSSTSNSTTTVFNAPHRGE